VGAPPVPRPHHGGRPTRVLPGAVPEAEAFREQATAQGHANRGYHNDNYVLPLTEPMAHHVGREPGVSVTVRIRRREALHVVIRTWRSEAKILAALGAVLPHIPECLFEGHGFAVHSYVEGEPLSATCANGKPVDPVRIQQLAGLLAGMARVRRESLPPLPHDWPRSDKDSQSFLQTLVRRADRQIRHPNWSDFGGLFAALGIPEDALDRLADRVPAMARRPYSLLHTDLHRDNVIVTESGEPPLICVDWELATYGDPLHDLATHLVRMRYPDDQRGYVIEAWAAAMSQVRPPAVNGLTKDLGHYVDFELAQSVYPDVMRAAKSLEEKFDDDALLKATESVHRALEKAAGPLRLRNVPGKEEVQRVLYRWQDSRCHARNGKRPGVGTGWKPHANALQEHNDFPFTAVGEALVAEGAAPAHQVFRGTAHLNTVVRVPDISSPVVVRRMAPRLCRREHSYLSEHKVLKAIEASAAEEKVSAPRILALGTSHQDEPFAIHTYEAQDTSRPPRHPVDGLRPYEADRLVDQLRALTRVDYGQIDKRIGEGGFYPWLSKELVRLVEELPQESREVARVLGLPDAPVLGRLLARAHITERMPALLHGDLNPWNLVRRDDPPGLTLIDWEMAVVGDPLYDLVRHMHLTPTRPEIRWRMFRRWERILEPQYTKDWEQDWNVYHRLEVIRSAYVDLDRMVTGVDLHTPNVRRAVASYNITLTVAAGYLGVVARPMAHPSLARLA